MWPCANETKPSRLGVRRKMASQEWEKPKAVVIPKETGHLPQGKYGPIFHKTPACYGFTIIAKDKPGTADTNRKNGNKMAKTLEDYPNVLAPLKLHYHL